MPIQKRYAGKIKNEVSFGKTELSGVKGCSRMIFRLQLPKSEFEEETMKIVDGKSYINEVRSLIIEYTQRLLKAEKYKQASIAVQKANYAVNMYKNVGFEMVDENEEEYIMICKL